MNIAEKPIAAIQGRRTSTGDGVHLIANHYKKGVRLDTHMHREAQLVYAAKGTMQVTTPRGRWLVPPDRAVWVPARLAHAIDVLADIDMRTLYFDLKWLGRKKLNSSLDSEFVVRVSRLLHESILALFDERNDAERTELLIRLAMLELHRAEDSATFIPRPCMKSRPWRARSERRREPCRGCFRPKRSSALKAGASAHASRQPSKSCPPRPASRSSRSPGSSAMPACRPSRMRSAR
jgi:AraC-like ligand binding domain